MKFLLFAMITVNVIACLYVALIAPILVYGWNNTAFNWEWAIAVPVLLAAGIGGAIRGYLWRKTRPVAALMAAGIPTIIAVVGGFLSILIAE